MLLSLPPKVIKEQSSIISAMSCCLSRHKREVHGRWGSSVQCPLVSVMRYLIEYHQKTQQYLGICAFFRMYPGGFPNVESCGLPQMRGQQYCRWKHTS